MLHRQTVYIRLAILASACSYCSIVVRHTSAQPVAESPSASAESTTPAAPADATDDAETAYTRVITERADKIVAPLGITDAAQATRVRDLIANQYRGLREIHDAIDA